MSDQSSDHIRGPRIRTLAVSAALGTILAILIMPSSALASPLPVSAPSTGPLLGDGLAGTQAIQAQINSGASGSTVHLPAGTFIGQLWVNTSEDLIGAGIGRTILQSPRAMTPDGLDNVFEIEIGHHATVEISELTVRVTEQCMLSNSIGVATGGGIGVRDDSTLDVGPIYAVAYGAHPDLNQACTTSQGKAGMLSFGRAVSLGLDDPPGTGTASQVEGHGSVHDVHTMGFDIFSLSVGGVRGPTGSTATITDNVVTVGPGPYTAAYGIVAYGVSTISNNVVIGTPGSDGGIAVVLTSAVVTHNVVRNFTCLNAPFPITPPCGVDPLFDDQDLGIFLASITPGTIVERNLIESVDAGMLVEGPGSPAVIAHNTIVRSTYYGLDLIDANQTFANDVVTGGLYAIAVAAGDINSTAVLTHDDLRGYAESLALLEANYPWVASVVVR
jgi:hypothetical protein